MGMLLALTLFLHFSFYFITFRSIKIKMNYWPQFLLSLLLILFYFQQFCFSMKKQFKYKKKLKPSKAILNDYIPNAIRQLPSSTLQQNRSQLQDPMTKSIQNPPLFSSPLNPEIESEDFNEFEIRNILSNDLYDTIWPKSNCDSTDDEEKARSNSQKTERELLKPKSSVDSTLEHQKQKKEEEDPKEKSSTITEKKQRKMGKQTLIIGEGDPPLTKLGASYAEMTKMLPKSKKTTATFSKSSLKGKKASGGGDENSQGSSTLSIPSSHSSIHHHQQQQAPKKKLTPSVKAIALQTIDKTPDGASPIIKVTDSGPELLEHGNVEEENQFEKLKIGQTKTEMIEEKYNDDENIEESVNSNQVQRSRPIAKSSKGKAKMSEDEMMKKEKDIEEFLNKEIEKRKMEELKLEIEKQKQEEEKEWYRKLEMTEKQLAKQALKVENVFSRNKKGIKKKIATKDLSPPIPMRMTKPSTDSTISTAGVQRHGDGEFSSGSIAGEGSNSATSSNSSNTLLPIPESYQIPQQTNISIAVENALCKAEGQVKYDQINKLLEELRESIIKIDELEKKLLSEKIKQFSDENKNENLSEKEKEIGALLDEFDKTNKLMVKEENKIAKLNKEKDDLFSEIQIKLKNIKSSNNKKNKRNKNILNEKVVKLQQAYDQKLKELEILENQKKEHNFIVQIYELQVYLMNEFTKFFNKVKSETERMKEIWEELKSPLKSLWILHNNVHDILNEHWKTPYIKEKFPKPLSYISLIYTKMMAVRNPRIENVIKREKEDYQKFENIMQLTLRKMLMYRNIYRNIEIKIKGASISVYEKLNCFDEFSEKMKSFAEECKKLKLKSKNPADDLKILGKIFKKKLNPAFHEVFRLIIVGIDQVPDIWDQMVLRGIGLLSGWWPYDRQRQLYEIWVQLFEYFEEEKNNLKFLSQYENDESALNVFDLPLDEEYFEERLKEQLKEINGLREFINSEKFSEDIKNMMSIVFSRIAKLIQNINMLTKIEKREKDAKPLPYLKSVYDKYWYMICKNRFYLYFTMVGQYHFGREISITVKAKKLNEKLIEMKQDRDTVVKPIFDQIDAIDTDILERLRKVIDVIDTFVKEKKIEERIKILEKNKDFMNSIADKNPNIEDYEMIMNALSGNYDEVEGMR